MCARRRSARPIFSIVRGLRSKPMFQFIAHCYRGWRPLSIYIVRETRFNVLRGSLAVSCDMCECVNDTRGGRGIFDKRPSQCCARSHGLPESHVWRSAFLECAGADGSSRLRGHLSPHPRARYCRGTTPSTLPRPMPNDSSRGHKPTQPPVPISAVVGQRGLPASVFAHRFPSIAGSLERGGREELNPVHDRRLLADGAVRIDYLCHQQYLPRRRGRYCWWQR